MTTVRTAAVLLVLSLSGCAANWHNPRIADPNIQRQQLAIDNGYCKRVAAGVPMPNMPAPLPPQGYAVSGSTTTYGPYGMSNGSYQGNAYAIQSPGTSFLDGMGQGAALGAVFRASRDQDEIYSGCMVAFGWVDG